MFSLIKGVYDYYTQKDEYSVIILGLDNAGKTVNLIFMQTLLEKIKTIFTNTPGLSADKIIPTVGMNRRIDFEHSRLKFWDLGGHPDLQSIWPKYYAECHGIIFVIDATDKIRLEEVQKTFSNLITNDLVEGVPILMLANKEDVVNALKVHEIKEYFNPIAVNLNSRDSKVMSVSAIKGTGIKEAINWLFLRLKLNSQAKPPNRVE